MGDYLYDLCKGNSSRTLLKSSHSTSARANPLLARMPPATMRTGLARAAARRIQETGHTLRHRPREEQGYRALDSRVEFHPLRNSTTSARVVIYTLYPRSGV